ncbi:MAG: helix-hairpin-helix domain-containing protein [Bacteroidota bacterium]
MQNDWKSAFHFTPVERRGILVLLVLTVSLWYLPVLYTCFQLTKEPMDFTELKFLLDSLEKLPDEPPKRSHPKTNYRSQKPKKSSIRFVFDPNQIGKDSLQLLGFPDFLADRLIKYRNAGGRFRKSSDLKKLYGLRPELYQSLEAYIQIRKKPSTYSSTKVENTKNTQPDPSSTESEGENPEPQTPEPAKTAYSKQVLINQADAEAFRALYGIGPVLSDRIVKFRDKLGGFYQVEQIKEVYGLPDSTWQHIQEHLVLDTVPVKRIAINELDTKGLSRHPYISWKEAKILVKYREMHGPIVGDSTLREMHGLDAKFRIRVLPYLRYN